MRGRCFSGDTKDHNFKVSRYLHIPNLITDAILHWQAPQSWTLCRCLPICAQCAQRYAVCFFGISTSLDPVAISYIVIMIFLMSGGPDLSWPDRIGCRDAMTGSLWQVILFALKTRAIMSTFKARNHYADTRHTTYMRIAKWIFSEDWLHFASDRWTGLACLALVHIKNALIFSWLLAPKLTTSINDSLAPTLSTWGKFSPSDPRCSKCFCVLLVLGYNDQNVKFRPRGKMHFTHKIDEWRCRNDHITDEKHPNRRYTDWYTSSIW